MLRPEEAQLFLQPNIGTFATTRRDGTTHLTPVWVDWDGEHVLVNTVVGRAKHRYIERDPRVSVLVVDRDDPARYVSVSGHATLARDGAEEHIDMLSAKYLGVESYPLRSPEEPRIIVRISVERAYQWNVSR